VRETPFDLLSRHIKVSHETFERLSTYHDLLLKWQSKINLISNDTIEDCWNRHFLDSAQLINQIPDSADNILDIGSGAGFPGMVLAIISNKKCHLIESDTKKATFLKEVARLTNTNVTIYNERVENISIPQMPLITARALANLNQLLNWSEKFVSHETISLFPKGKNYSTELEDAKIEWAFDSEILPSVTDTNGVIVKLSHIKRRRS